MFARVAWHSLRNRKYTALLTLISIAISTFVLLGVEHIRHEAKESFSKTVSGVDLIVGARIDRENKCRSLKKNGIGCGSHRRCAYRTAQPAAVFRFSYRQPDQ